MENISKTFKELHDSICEACEDLGEHHKYCAGWESIPHWEDCKCQIEEQML